MGWTSKPYKKTTHLEFNDQNAMDLISDEFATNGYITLTLYLKKAQRLIDNNEIYVVMKHPQGAQFAMVVLVDIVDEEIFWKEMTESMGPVYYDMPKNMLFYLSETDSDYAKEWRKKVRSRNINDEFYQFNYVEG